jgi:hypothetical protein
VKIVIIFFIVARLTTLSLQTVAEMLVAVGLVNNLTHFCPGIGTSYHVKISLAFVAIHPLLHGARTGQKTRYEGGKRMI